MYGLLVLAIVIVWGSASIVIARWIGGRIPKKGPRIVITLLLIPLFFVLPLADEIVGRFQFEKLCKEAEEIKIFGTMPVGEGLYTANGQWRRSHTAPLLSLEDSNKLSQLTKNLLRYEHTEIYSISAVMPISGSESKVFSRDSGQLLVIYRIYGTPGGWLSRNFEKPLIVRNQCLPKDHLDIEKRILPFNK